MCIRDSLYGLHMFPWLAEWLSPPAADWLIRLSALPAWGVVVAWLVVRLRAAQAIGPAAGQLGELATD